jgi:membrane protein implicated in regulation of membrane protease activity
MIAVDILTGAAFIVAVGIGALAGRIGIDPQWGILFFVIGIALALVRAAMSEGRGGQG